MVKQFPVNLAGASRGPIDLAARGMAHARRGHLLAALRSMHRSIQNDSDCYPAWLGLVEIFGAIGDGRRAGECWRIARRLRASGPRSSQIARVRRRATA